MITRALTPRILDAIVHSPAVALLGPRQSGKTTLALEVGKDRGALYLDLESEQDRAKLAQPELYLADHQDKLVILDEVHRVPGLFPVLRGLIDRGRRAGRRAGQYLLPGSASLDLLKQSGETLAGRIAYLELTPFQVLEVRHLPADALWLRGGFPESLLASGVARSLRWRQDFIRSYLERRFRACCGTASRDRRGEGKVDFALHQRAAACRVARRARARQIRRTACRERIAIRRSL